MKLGFYKLAGIKIIILAYGSDMYCYSRVLDKNLTAGLLMSYPKQAEQEKVIQQRVNYWDAKADCVLRGIQLDGAGRWDVNIVSALVVDENSIKQKEEYSYF